MCTCIFWVYGFHISENISVVEQKKKQEEINKYAGTRVGARIILHTTNLNVAPIL